MKTTILRFQCDRCPNMLDDEKLPPEWGRLAINGNGRSIGVEAEVHLCPGCVEAMFDAFHGVTDPVPAPPPPPPEPKRKRITLETRRELEGIVEDALTLQASATASCIRADPVALQFDEMIPAVARSIRPRAAEAVKLIIAALPK